MPRFTATSQTSPGARIRKVRNCDIRATPTEILPPSVRDHVEGAFVGPHWRSPRREPRISNGYNKHGVELRYLRDTSTGSVDVKDYYIHYNYLHLVVQVGVPILENELKNLKIPDISGSAKGSVYNVEYSLTRYETLSLTSSIYLLCMNFLSNQLDYQPSGRRQMCRVFTLIYKRYAHITHVPTVCVLRGKSRS